MELNIFETTIFLAILGTFGVGACISWKKSIKYVACTIWEGWIIVTKYGEVIDSYQLSDIVEVVPLKFEDKTKVKLYLKDGTEHVIEKRYIGSYQVMDKMKKLFPSPSSADPKPRFK